MHHFCCFIQQTPSMSRINQYYALFLLLVLSHCHGFVVRDEGLQRHHHPQPPSSSSFPSATYGTQLYYDSTDSNSDNNNNDSASKFGFGQRIESIKSLAIGGISGSVAYAPVGFVKDVILDHSPLAQWEFDTDMAALQGGLFAIVYRYCVRQDTNNPQLNQGVIGAFVLTRTLSAIHVPSYCSAVPLECEFIKIVF
jgi:hypothetical protein